VKKPDFRQYPVQISLLGRKVVRWLMAPFWIAALATSAKSFKDNPLIGSLALNKLGLLVARARLAHFMAALRRKKLAHLLDAQDRQDFDRQGYVMKPDFLPADVFAAVQREIAGMGDEAREMRQGRAVTRRVALDARVLRQMPATRRVLQGRPWRNLLSYAAASRCYPMNYIQSICTHAGPGRSDPQTALHSDTFHPTVKAWLFLTDVGPDDCPLIYVPGSHRLNRRRLAWMRRKSLQMPTRQDRMSSRGSLRITPRELARLGYAAPRALFVKKNTLIVADTSGFHARGQSRYPSTRAEIWAYGRRNPFLPWTGWDIQGLPGLRDRVVPIYWRALDMMEKLGWARNPWRRAAPSSESDHSH